MITLGLLNRNQPLECEDSNEPISLFSIETRLTSALSDLSALLQQARQSTVILPSEVLFQAVHDLFPAERMGVMPVRRLLGCSVVGGLCDITGVGQRVHVRADPSRLAAALIAFERSGAGLGVWIHSHPGLGPGATTPSGIDRSQYADWVRDYDSRLIGIIVVEDGFIRLWGKAVESGQVRVEVLGDGIKRVKGYEHVYKLEQ